MLEITGSIADDAGFGETRRHSTCDDLWRRNFISVGSLAAGSLTFGGLTLADVLRAKATAAESNGTSLNDTAVILVWLAGGPCHLDMYDLKPNAPAEFRGEFHEIATNVPGIRISEHLPLQAAMMDQLAVVRSATHTNAGHGM